MFPFRAVLLDFLEEMFPEANMQMITTVINPSGKAGLGFSVVCEYIFMVYFGRVEDTFSKTTYDMLFEDTPYIKKHSVGLKWESLLRSGSGWNPAVRPNLFYPIVIDAEKEQVIDVGLPANLSEPLPREKDGKFLAWPIKSDGSYGIWRLEGNTLMSLVNQGFSYVSSFDKERNTYALKYLMKGDLKRIESGEIEVKRTGKHGEVEITSTYFRKKTPKNVWNVSSHNAGKAGGSDWLNDSIGRNKFSFPKSLYAVYDTLRFFIASKPNALILDFFAGSGTTLHAVNLLNAEDGGNRRCILVTNNEVSADEAKTLTKDGHKPGDDEWEKLGIARYVTWPRTVCSIEGHDVNGEPLKGSYLGSERPMADGFPANAIFFKLGFLDKTAVALGTQFAALLSTLWMKAGAVGACPEMSDDELPDMLILPKNQFAVLLEEMTFPLFQKRMKDVESIRTIFFVTDSEPNFRKMSKSFPKTTTYQLYRDYLSNFRINTGRQSC